MYYIYRYIYIYIHTYWRYTPFSNKRNVEEPQQFKLQLGPTFRCFPLICHAPFWITRQFARRQGLMTDVVEQVGIEWLGKWLGHMSWMPKVNRNNKIEVFGLVFFATSYGYLMMIYDMIFRPDFIITFTFKDLWIILGRDMTKGAPVRELSWFATRLARVYSHYNHSRGFLKRYAKIVLLNRIFPL